MTNELQRVYIKDGLQQCTAAEIHLFRRMYSNNDLYRNINEIIADMTDRQLESACHQIKNTLKRKRKDTQYKIKITGENNINMRLIALAVNKWYGGMSQIQIIENSKENHILLKMKTFGDFDSVKQTLKGECIQFESNTDQDINDD